MKMYSKAEKFHTFFGFYGFLSLWILIIAGVTCISTSPLFGQEPQQGMSVRERDVEGKGVRFDFDFPSGDLQSLIKFISAETNLAIIASENDIKDKKFALTNLKNVTLAETLEAIKTVLAQYNLTMIRTNSTLLITTFDKAIQMKVPVRRVTVAEANLIEQTDEIQTYIIQLNSATASDLVNGIKPLLNKAANIFADANSNSLVITDVASNIHRIASILYVADEAPEMPLKVEIVPLSNATARSLAQTLNDMFREEGQVTNLLRKMSGTNNPDEMRKMMEQAKEKGGGVDMLRGRIQIAADESSNSLVIKASESNLIVLKELIAQLDTAPNVQSEIRIFRLNYAIAQDVAQTLEEVITGQSAGRRPGRNAQWWEQRDWERRRQDMRRNTQDQEYQGIIGTVNVSSNDRLNAVVVSSDPRNFTLIEKVIKELDQAKPQEEIRIFFLQFADAQTLSDNLKDLFEGGNAGQDRNTPWWWRQQQQQTGGESTGFGVQGEVHLVPDTRLNALMVSTAAQNFETIDGLVKRLDVNMPDQEWGTRIYKLKYADAENVAEIINNVYQGSNNNNRGGFFFFVPGRQRNQNQGSLAGNVTAEAYPTLNAVIVSTATQRNFELISQFIEEIDTSTPDDQREVTKSIRLEYASAQQIQQVLNDVWSDQGGGGGGGGFNFARFFARGGRLEQKDINSLRGKVTVYADPQTNSLIVTTAQRYMPDVEALIHELDFIRGQVWIDIQILEVTLDESTKLGLELTAKENKLFGAELRPENPLVGGVDPKLGLNQEISGFNYSLATKEYMALLHTLMRENKVRTLSTPSLLTRDNQQATWNRGRKIPFLQSVDTRSILGNNVSQPLFNYSFIDPPVGINITLTPHIAKSREGPEGKRTIGLDIDQIEASNFIEFTSFNAPITETSSISAYIDVEDGQQIVVGGMIKSKQQKTENKVPILGDIPFLGRLFKGTENVTENSEIVIIITPHIIDIRNPDDLERLKKQADEWRNNNNGAPDGNGKVK
ncbi:hypothetical protein HYR99_15765 [Candidatus Poribacteria bacterium]|nr:hypothetical protein [Candidatus Poribacteria bacterium]